MGDKETNVEAEAAKPQRANPPPPGARPHRKALIFRLYFILPLLVILLTLVEGLLSYLPFSDPISPADIGEFHRQQVDPFMEMVKLLLTLATLTIGAISGFVVNHGKSQKFTRRQLRRIISSWSFCAASLYFGYLAYQQASWELYYGFFNAHNPRLWWPIRGQFWSFLIGVVMFADYIYDALPGKSVAS